MLSLLSGDWVRNEHRGLEVAVRHRSVIAPWNAQLLKLSGIVSGNERCPLERNVRRSLVCGWYFLFSITDDLF